MCVLRADESARTRASRPPVALRHLPCCASRAGRANRGGRRRRLVVDFWAPWCSPCRRMAPELEKAATHVAGSALIVKVDIDAVPALGERFRIRSVPTLAVFRGGREVSRFAGARSASDIEALVHGT
jgi:thioredoxin